MLKYSQTLAHCSRLTKVLQGVLTSESNEMTTDIFVGRKQVLSAPWKENKPLVIDCVIENKQGRIKLDPNFGEFVQCLLTACILLNNYVTQKSNNKVFSFSIYYFHIVKKY